MFKRYIEVYTTFNLADFSMAKTTLADAGIQCKDTSLNNQMIRSFTNFQGHASVPTRVDSSMTIYRLSVKKDDVHKARFLLNKM